MKTSPKKSLRTAAVVAGIAGVLSVPSVAGPASADTAESAPLVFPTVPELGTTADINGLDSTQIQARIDALTPEAQHRLEAAIAARAADAEAALAKHGTP